MCMSAAEDTDPTAPLVIRGTFNIAAITAQAEPLPNLRIIALKEWELELEKRL